MESAFAVGAGPCHEEEERKKNKEGLDDEDICKAFCWFFKFYIGVILAKYGSRNCNFDVPSRGVNIFMK
jgi:hypothetical protein